MYITKTTGWTKERLEQIQALPMDPQEATWQCETCGSVTPHAYDVRGVTHYSRSMICNCQIKAHQQAEKDAQQRQWVEKSAKYTYGWLGSQWDNAALRKKTFESFDAERQSEAYEMTRIFAKQRKGTLVLYGSFGTGKTHLLSALCNESLAKYEATSLFALVPDLFAAIQWRIGHHEDYYDLVDKAARTPLLVLDDIDKAKHTDFREEIYLSIIDKRVNRELPTAISTNRLSELANFVGGAVASRLQIGQIAMGTRHFFA
jgi:DNA replication protein DnaC